MSEILPAPGEVEIQPKESPLPIRSVDGLYYVKITEGTKIENIDADKQPKINDEYCLGDNDNLSLQIISTDNGNILYKFEREEDKIVVKQISFIKDPGEETIIDGCKIIKNTNGQTTSFTAQVEDKVVLLGYQETAITPHTTVQLDGAFGKTTNLQVKKRYSL